MEPIILADFAVNVTFSKLIEKLHIEEEDDIELMQEKWDEALTLVKTKAIYKESYIDSITADTVTIEGTTFTSPTLAEKLNSLHRVFAYVVSCGTEIDDWSHKEEDPFLYLWLDMMKELMLYDAERQFQAHIKEKFGISKVAAMCPGSGNLDTWPIEAQGPLFQLIGDVKEKIGVTLTPSFLMLPTKSVSGLLFPTEVDFMTCSLCKREHCPGRQAAYTGKQS